MSRPTPPTYKTRNWPAYNEALKRRGSLTIWFDPEMIWDAAPVGKRGRQQTCSDAAIQTCLTMKVLFGMALRQTTGFVESLLRLIGLNWTVPDFSKLSRRQKTLAVNRLCRKLLGHRCVWLQLGPTDALCGTSIRTETLISFKGAHYPKDVILYAVYFYVRFGVSYRDLEEIMGERGVCVDHATLNRWVEKYA